MRTRFYRCQLPLMMCSGLLPLPLLLCCFFGSGALLPWLIAPAAYLLLACLCMLLPGKVRLLAAIPGMLAMMAGCYIALSAEETLLRILAPAMYVALLLFTLPIAGWERGREPPVLIPALCITAHLLAQFFLFLKPLAEGTLLKAAVPPMLLGSFVVFLLLFMLSMNRQSMANAMPDSHSVPVSIRRRNRILTLVLLALVLLISLIPAIGKAVSQLMEWLKKAILMIVEWILSLFSSKEPMAAAGGGEAANMFGIFDAEETSALAQLLEKIFIALTAVLLVFIILWVLRFLWRRLVKLMRYIYGQLRHYAASAGEDYVDEVEDTREQGAEHFNIAQKILRRRSALRGLKDLPPREQIRARYSLLRGKHPEWARSDTARETLNETSAQLYERARYSSHEITQKDSETFANHQNS